MSKNLTNSMKEIGIADLYPELSSEEQAKAEFNLLGYLDVVRRIFERVAIENPKLLTELENSASLKGKQAKGSFSEL